MLLVIWGSCLVASFRTLRSAVAVGAGDDVVDGALVVELEVHGLREGVFELVCSCRRRQVEEGAVDRRDRDAFVVGGVLGIEGTSAVQADPRDAVAGCGGGDVDALLAGREEFPVGRSAAMAHTAPGPRPALPPTGGPPAEHGAADGVDAVMDAAQPTRPHPAPRRRARPRPRAAAPRQDTPLPARRARPPPDQGGGALTECTYVDARATPRACQATRDSGHRKRNDSASARAPPALTRYRRAWRLRPRKPTSSRSGAISPRRCRGRAATR